jgi:hypothetical protein
MVMLQIFKLGFSPNDSNSIFFLLYFYKTISSFIKIIQILFSKKIVGNMTGILYHLISTERYFFYKIISWNKIVDYGAHANSFFLFLF